MFREQPSSQKLAPTQVVEKLQRPEKVKQTYYDGMPIRTVAEAERFCDVPERHQLKCNQCGRVAERDESKEYRYQADCDDGCEGQMMGTDWPGWYNHWRELALNLLTQTSTTSLDGEEISDQGNAAKNSRDES